MATPNVLKRLMGALGVGAKAAKTAENIVGPVAGFQRRLAQAEKVIPGRRAAQAKFDAEYYPDEPSYLRLSSGQDSRPEHHVLAARQMESAVNKQGALSQETVDHHYDAYHDVRRSREAFEADPHNADLLGNLKNSIGQLVERNEQASSGAKIDWSKTATGNAPFTPREIDTMRPGNVEHARNHYQGQNALIADQKVQHKKPPVEGQEPSDEIDFTRTHGYSGGVDPERVTLEEKEIAEYKARKRTYVDKGREERADDYTNSEPYYDRMNPSLKPGEDPQEGGTYGLEVTQRYMKEDKRFGLVPETDQYREEYGYYRDGRDGKEFDATSIVQHGERQAVGGDLDRGGEYIERDSAGNAYPIPYRNRDYRAGEEGATTAGAPPPPPPPSPAAAPTSPGPAASTPASGPVNPAPPPPPPSSTPPPPPSAPRPPTPPKAPVARGTLSVVGGDEPSSLRAVAGAMGGALDPLLIGAGGGAMGFAHGALSYNEEAETDPDFKNAPGIGRLNNALMEGAAGALKGVAVGAGITGIRAVGSANIGNFSGARNGAGGALSMITGGVTGAFAGGFAGSVVPGAGTALGAIMGGISGLAGGAASAMGSKSMTGSFIEGFGESLFSRGVGAFRTGGGDFSEKAAGASDIINRSLFGKALNSSKGVQREISTLEGRLAGDLSEDSIAGAANDTEAGKLTALRGSTEKLLEEKRAQFAKGLPDHLQDEIGSKPVSLGMRDLPGIAGGLAGYVAGTAASLPVTAYKAWRSGIATPYYGYEDYSDRGAAGQVFGEVFQNSAWRGTIKPILESIAGPLTEGAPGAARQMGGAGIGGLVGGLIGGAAGGPLGAIGGAAFGARMVGGAVDRAAINVASGAKAPKAAPKSLAGKLKSAFTKNPNPGPAAVSAGADSLFNPATNLALGVGLTGAIASTVATALPNAFAAGAEVSSAGAPMGHPMNALRNRKDPIAQSRAQMEADQSNKVRMTNPGMIGLSDIEEPYHTNTSFKPTRGKHTPGKYNDTGDLVFALSALRRG